MCAPSEEPPTKLVALCDELCALNVIEMNQLVNLFKDKVGLSGVDVMPQMMVGSAMPQAAATAADPAAESAPAEEAKAKDSFDVKLVGFDAPNKIKVIKEVRAITGLGLKEAKELVEGIPKTMKKDVPKADAEAMVEKLKAVGAKVDLE